MSSLLTLERKQKILQMYFKFADFHFVLIHLELKERKPYPVPDQNTQSVCPFSDQNDPKEEGWEGVTS